MAVCSLGRNAGLGDWLFSVTAFGDLAPDPAGALLHRYPRAKSPQRVRADETVEDYRRQDELIGHLTHLQPPHSIGRIVMERFSPALARAAHPRAPATSIRS